MANSLTLTTTIKQTLKLSPAQIQVMKLLELTTCELQTQINEELQKNPALEEGAEGGNEIADTNNTEDEFVNPLNNEDFNYDEYTQDDDVYDHGTHNTGTTSRPQEEIPFSIGISFAEYIKQQIYLTKMDKPDRHIAKYIVGNINGDGYLIRSLDSIADDLVFKENIVVTEAHLQEILEQIQTFEPAGVGARDLQECLLIQLKQKKSTKARENAMLIISKYYETLTKCNNAKIQQKLNLTYEELQAALHEIQILNPKPSSAWQGTRDEQNREIIIPDFIVERTDDRLVVSLANSDITPLHVSADYTQLLEKYSQPNQTAKQQEAGKEIKKYVESARTFIDAIHQRNETMIRCMQALVKFQREFFLQGDSIYLKPMILNDIAQLTGYDISTVSRTFNDKHVSTEYGTFALKYFFSEGMTNKDGETNSTRAIKEQLLEIVNNEDKHNPMTDDELVDAVKEAGFNIARRTVAKYRSQLNIPVARYRRKM